MSSGNVTLAYVPGQSGLEDAATLVIESNTRRSCQVMHMRGTAATAMWKVTFLPCARKRCSFLLTGLCPRRVIRLWGVGIFPQTVQELFAVERRRLPGASSSS